jgi:hypothetical protein
LVLIGAVPGRGDLKLRSGGRKQPTVSTVGFGVKMGQALAGAAENRREMMLPLPPRPGLAPFRRLTHGFFRTHLAVLKNSVGDDVRSLKLKSILK